MQEVAERKTILLVDDDLVLLEIGKDMLESCGYRVIPAGSGEEAIELFKRNDNSFDLVLMDYSMRGMDGIQCMQELLRVDPRLKVILMSGLGDNYQCEAALSAGARAFLSKPYRMNEMLLKMEEILNFGG